jgi:hypothetical protein
MIRNAVSGSYAYFAYHVFSVLKKSKADMMFVVKIPMFQGKTFPFGVIALENSFYF